MRPTSMYVISYSKAFIFYSIYGGRKGTFELTKFEAIPTWNFRTLSVSRF